MNDSGGRKLLSHLFLISRWSASIIDRGAGHEVHGGFGPDEAAQPLFWGGQISADWPNAIFLLFFFDMFPLATREGLPFSRYFVSISSSFFSGPKLVVSSQERRSRTLLICLLIAGDLVGG